MVSDLISNCTDTIKCFLYWLKNRIFYIGSLELTKASAFQCIALTRHLNMLINTSHSENVKVRQMACLLYHFKQLFSPSTLIFSLPLISSSLYILQRVTSKAWNIFPATLFLQFVGLSLVFWYKLDGTFVCYFADMIKQS